MRHNLKTRFYFLIIFCFLPLDLFLFALFSGIFGPFYLTSIHYFRTVGEIWTQCPDIWPDSVRIIWPIYSQYTVFSYPLQI